jgi:hypothetical protein
VVGVARRGRDRVVDAGRDTEPLTAHVRTAAGEERIGARALVDAADRIVYRVPELADPTVRARYAGRRVAIAGSGHSALTALVALAPLIDPNVHSGGTVYPRTVSASCPTQSRAYIWWG